MIIADETDEAAVAKWEHYKAGADSEALAWLDDQARGRHKPRRRHQRAPAGRRRQSAVNINMGTLVGSYANVARMLDEMADRRRAATASC